MCRDNLYMSSTGPPDRVVSNECHRPGDKKHSGPDLFSKSEWLQKLGENMEATGFLVGWCRGGDGKRSRVWNIAFMYVKQGSSFICHSPQASWLRRVTGLCFGKPCGMTPEHKLVTLLPLSPGHTSTAWTESCLQSWGLTHIHHKLTSGYHYEELPWQCQFSKHLPDQMPNHFQLTLVPKLHPLPGFFHLGGLGFLIFFPFLQLLHNPRCEPVQLPTPGASCPSHQLSWSSKQLIHGKHVPLWPMNSLSQGSQWHTVYSVFCLFIWCAPGVFLGPGAVAWSICQKREVLGGIYNPGSLVDFPLNLYMFPCIYSYIWIYIWLFGKTCLACCQRETVIIASYCKDAAYRRNGF